MGDTRIEHAGENWGLLPDVERPTIQVVAMVRSTERIETTERPGKKGKHKPKKQQPFGFGRCSKPA
jgi:hypothetical protein